MAKDQQTVADKKVVTIQFVATDPSGEVVDQAPADKPMRYLHGAQSIVPGLEKAFDGRSVGDEVSVTVPPEQGYGALVKERPVEVRRSELGFDGPVTRGMPLMMRGPDGQPIPLWIKKVQGRSVILTRNHPLAGVTLKFECEVLDVRDATAEELQHGHAHGPGGHDHGGHDQGDHDHDHNHGGADDDHDHHDEGSSEEP
jgi:FKBP-type peptidyl-prolyl cis-trans isomerase SlyD